MSTTSPVILWRTTTRRGRAALRVATVVAATAWTLLAAATPSHAAIVGATSITSPPVTTPTVTVPAVTLPPVTVPLPTVAPPVTVPPVTLPPVTLPPVTLPPVTVPVTAPIGPPTAPTTVPTTIPGGLPQLPVGSAPGAPGTATGAGAGGAPSSGAVNGRTATGADARVRPSTHEAALATDTGGMDVNLRERSLPAAIANSVRSFIPAVALLVLIAGFLVAEASFDRRDPKLARSPLDDTDETIPFS